LPVIGLIRFNNPSAVSNQNVIYNVWSFLSFFAFTAPAVIIMTLKLLSVTILFCRSFFVSLKSRFLFYESLHVHFRLSSNCPRGLLFFPDFLIFTSFLYDLKCYSEEMTIVWMAGR